MTLANLLVAVSSLWLFNCVAIRHKNKEDPFITTWAPIIAYLNEDPGPPVVPLDDVTVNLVTKNKSMLEETASAWSMIEPKGLAKKDLIRAKNRYFHDAIGKRNDEDSRALNGAMSRIEPPKDYRSVAERIMKSVESNPVASSKNVANFEGGEQIGFCFGRALFVHYLLRKAGVPQRDILKIFVLGDLLVATQFWHFHVAVMVRDSKAGFIVVDPLYGSVVDLDNWMAEVSKLEIKYPLSHARFYATDARKFRPEVGLYSLEALSPPELKNYFERLGSELEKYSPIAAK